MFHCIKLKNFGTEKFWKTTSGKKLSDVFQEFWRKKLSDTHDIKNKHVARIYVKNNCDSIININFFIYSIKNLQYELLITLPTNYSSKHYKDENPTGSNRL